ncbi:MAG: beta-galactosidase, partial [Acidobacteriota bacterium]
MVLIGPRSGSKTSDFQIPETLPPNLPKAMLDVTVSQSESLRADCPIALSEGSGQIRFWREFLDVGEA